MTNLDKLISKIKDLRGKISFFSSEELNAFLNNLSVPIRIVLFDKTPFWFPDSLNILLE
jgi:hypothetical protein